MCGPTADKIAIQISVQRGFTQICMFYLSICDVLLKGWE